MMELPAVLCREGTLTLILSLLNCAINCLFALDWELVFCAGFDWMMVAIVVFFSIYKGFDAK